MPKVKRKPVEIDEDDLDDEEDDLEEGDEEEAEEASRARDFVMARLAAARASAQASINMIDDAMHLFVNPVDDKKGDDRKEMLDAALEEMGSASRALEAAEERYEEIDPTEEEPWEEDGEEDDE
jgi:hypothetical protein